MTIKHHASFLLLLAVMIALTGCEKKKTDVGNSTAATSGDQNGATSDTTASATSANAGDITKQFEDAARAILDYALNHAASAEGQVPYALWPQGVKGHFLVRVPPAGYVAT